MTVSRRIKLKLNKMAISGILFQILIFTGCSDLGPDSDNGPAFSNIALSDTIYSSYAGGKESDTVILSFNYSLSGSADINVDFTPDSGESWFNATVIAVSNSGRATIKWVIGNDSLHFGYFGIKKVFMKIYEASSSVNAAFSDTFMVTGNAPLMISSPSGGENFSINDSINVVYGRNMDLVSNVKVCFRPDDTSYVLIALSDANSAVPVTLYEEGTIIVSSRKFCPAGFTGFTSAWLTLPMIIILKDYGSAGALVSSGDISISQ
jgi:hypothetical protein